MDETGVFIKGVLAGMEQKISTFDRNQKIQYKYLVVSGIEPFLITSEVDYREILTNGMIVKFRVQPKVFAEKIYFIQGDLIE